MCREDILKIKFLQWFNCLILKTPVFDLMLVIIILIRVYLIFYRILKVEFKFNNGTFQIIMDPLPVA